MKRDFRSARCPDYDTALTLDPDSAFTYNNRGYAFKLKGDHERALADYSRSIDFDANCAIAYLNRAGLHYRRDDYALAIEDFTRPSTCRCSLQSSPMRMAVAPTAG